MDSTQVREVASSSNAAPEEIGRNFSTKLVGNARTQENVFLAVGKDDLFLLEEKFSGIQPKDVWVIQIALRKLSD